MLLEPRHILAEGWLLEMPPTKIASDELSNPAQKEKHREITCKEHFFEFNSLSDVQRAYREFGLRRYPGGNEKTYPTLKGHRPAGL